MSSHELSKDLITILKFIQETGGIHCSGSCARQKPGEVHCHSVSEELNISPTRTRDHIGTLRSLGLIDCQREQLKTGSVRAKFTVSSEGLEALQQG